MNFLSHFYFEQQSPQPYQACGMLLPDLVKNAKYSGNLRPHKHPELFDRKESLKALLIGWKRHLKVDLIFHQAPFFVLHSAQLKEALKPLLVDTPIRPSFLGHIGLELLLDHLLVRDNKIHIPAFYEALDEVEKPILNEFLVLSGLTDTDAFFSFLDQFKSSRYLFSYQKLENISYALRRICLRLWPSDFPEARLPELTACLGNYLIRIETNYMQIFDEIELRLGTN
ncbi:MAG: hypothetical protein EOO99_10590 [Pedobacter sp.]|nr:MAG: hypothetical protein EOO99_10590 [Pedobacter sp.]